MRVPLLPRVKWGGGGFTSVALPGGCSRQRLLPSSRGLPPGLVWRRGRRIMAFKLPL